MILSWRTLTFKPARWRLSRLNRYSKNPRRFTTRQSHYKQLRILLPDDAQSQLDCVYRKMQERDLLAGVNSQVTKGRHPRTWMSFQDCLELQKLTVFTADAAKRQQFYIQQAVCKPRRATVRQHISQIGVLNDFVKHFPTLKDSP
jgi:hypothetical protein